MILLKEKLYLFCLQLLDDKIKRLLLELNELKEGAENNAKSSAGDKHETARAMMQIEQGELSRQMNELLKQKNTLEIIGLNSASSVITEGCLIKANGIYMYLTVAIGRVVVNNTVVVVFIS